MATCGLSLGIKFNIREVRITMKKEEEPHSKQRRAQMLTSSIPFILFPSSTTPTRGSDCSWA